MNNSVGKHSEQGDTRLNHRQQVLFKTVRQEPERDIPEHRITFEQFNVNISEC